MAWIDSECEPLPTHTRRMRAYSVFPARQSGRGFTLIELMIAVVVVAILAGLAFPTFMGAIRKSRRAEAFTALASVQQAQERWRANNASYASDLTSASPTGLALSSATPGSHYTISVANPDATSYEAIATAASGSTQAGDGTCAKLGVKMSAGNLTYGGTTAAGTLTYTATNPCWSR